MPSTAVTLALMATTASAAIAATIEISPNDIANSALLESLPGFTEGTVLVDGVNLHYVSGGKGSPVVLLPGWPETWWAWHKIMPGLAKDHTAISVDLRGMGASDKPADGYEKKVLAKDVYELVKKLGYEKADIIGHDIGSMVAFSCGANYPKAIGKLVMIDIPYPDASMTKWPLLPTVGTFGDKSFRAFASDKKRRTADGIFGGPAPCGI